MKIMAAAKYGEVEHANRFRNLLDALSVDADPATLPCTNDDVDVLAAVLMAASRVEMRPIPFGAGR